MDISFYACGLQKPKLKLAGLEEKEIIFPYIRQYFPSSLCLRRSWKMDPLFIF